MSRYKNANAFAFVKPLPSMQRYPNLSGNSGVVAYGIHADSLRVMFKNGSVYTYTRQSVGEDNLRLMRALATQGRGLSTFISTVVKDNYAHVEEPGE
jgi:hypothetical protein